MFGHHFQKISLTLSQLIRKTRAQQMSKILLLTPLITDLKKEQVYCITVLKYSFVKLWLITKSKSVVFMQNFTCKIVIIWEYLVLVSWGDVTALPQRAPWWTKSYITKWGWEWSTVTIFQNFNQHVYIMAIRMVVTFTIKFLPFAKRTTEWYICNCRPLPFEFGRQPEIEKQQKY